MFPQDDVTHHLDPKRPSLGGNTSFEPFSVRIGAMVRPGRVNEKKYRITKKSQKCYISPIWGKPPLDRFDSKVACMVGDIWAVITCAKFQVEISICYDFTRGRIFDFPIDFCMGLTTV